jgi:Flp pilus assembly protein TadD
MNSTREAATRNEEYAQREARRRRHAVRVVLAVFGTIFFALGAAGTYWIFGRNFESRLEKARVNLRAAAEEADLPKRRALGMEASRELEAYLAGWGRHAESAKVLAAAAYAAGEEGAQAAFSEHRQYFLYLERQPDVAAVAPRDLALAADVLWAHNMRLAEWLVQQALARNDDRQAVLRVAARVRYEQRRDDEALAHSRELQAIDERDPFAWEVMGAIYENRNFIDQLPEVYRKRLELEPEKAAELRPRLIQFLIKSGDIPEARRQFGLLDRQEATLESRIVEIQLLEAEGESRSALRAAEEAIAEYPKDVTLLLSLGRIRLAQGELEQAVTALGELVALDPGNNEAHYLLGQAYARQAKPELAKRHLDEQRRILDVRVKLHDLEGRAAKQPQDAALRREISRLYESIGLKEQAEFWARGAGRMEGHSH